MKNLERILFFLFFLSELGMGVGIVAWIFSAFTTTACGGVFFGVAMLLSALISAYIVFPVHLF